jgi:hypothetical protein
MLSQARWKLKEEVGTILLKRRRQKARHADITYCKSFGADWTFVRFMIVVEFMILQTVFALESLVTLFA